jgi:cyclase
MTTFRRLVARLDCKGTNVIKGIQLEGLRIVGNIRDLALQRYNEGADELFILDAVASLYDGTSLAKTLEEITRECFIPITVGGGIQELKHADMYFRAGADKVALNSGAIRRPSLISELSEKYGSQAIVVHIEAKRTLSDRGPVYSCFVDNGRDDSGLLAGTWASEAAALGAGEILVTSIDRDGTKSGPELDLLREVRQRVDVPVIASSGFSKSSELVSAFNEIGVDGISIASALHSNILNLETIRSELRVVGVSVR